MRTVWKINLGLGETITLPAEAKPVHAGFQYTVSLRDLCVWFEVDTDQPMKKWDIQVIGTGFEIPADMTHIASLQQDRFVWHLYGREL